MRENCNWSRCSRQYRGNATNKRKRARSQVNSLKSRLPSFKKIRGNNPQGLNPNFKNFRRKKFSRILTCLSSPPKSKNPKSQLTNHLSSPETLLRVATKTFLSSWQSIKSCVKCCRWLTSVLGFTCRHKTRGLGKF